LCAAVTKLFSLIAIKQNALMGNGGKVSIAVEIAKMISSNV
jgi:hypothetical protein